MNHNYVNALPEGSVLTGKTYRYKIKKILGQGSFGITYLASVEMNGDLGTLDAYVAIKEFFMSEINGRDNTSVTSSNKAGLFDKYKRKFIKEAQALGRLRHPGIVKVLESFEMNNTVYYAMDFIDGGSLDQYISHSGGLPEKEALDIARMVMDALAYMHSKNMLHLDLKPSNIMMKHGKPVLIDFGLSKQYDENGHPESSTTIGAGTPGYAPLEQSNYNGDAPDTLPVTMDIYALGATLFKMLTGRRAPIASDILNLGFPEQEIDAKGVSRKTISLTRHLMEPLLKNRPQSDAAVKAEFDRTDTDDEETDFRDTTIKITPGGNTPGGSRGPVIPEPKKPERKFGRVAFIAAAAIALLIIIFSLGKSGGDSYTDEQLADSVAIIEPDYPAESPVQSPRSDIPRPNITYRIRGNFDDSGLCDNSQLCASIDGEDVTIGSISYIFGPDNMSNMNIFAQEDFDGDGITDVLVYDANIGSGGGSKWAFITYDGGNSFKKSNLFSEASYYEPVISEVNGRKVLDFVSNDMGQKIVRERHGLKDGNAVALSLPGSRTQAYSILKSINMDDKGEKWSFDFDLNGDGISERIYSTGTYHFGRNFEFNMNGGSYEFDAGGLWGGGTLHILKSMTNGMHDLMLEQETRSLFRWDGSTYKFIEN